MVSGKATILNQFGLHARSASAMTQVAERYECEIEITCRDKVFSAKRIVNVLMASIKYGDVLTITCTGKDENKALKAMLESINSGLGEVIVK